MHRHVVAQALKISGARNEVALAIHFHQHANFSAGVDVVAHQSFGSSALRFLCRCGLSFLAQDADGLFDVAFRFKQRFSTSGETRAGAVAQLFHELGRNVRIASCSHRFTRFLFDKFGLCRLWCGLSSATLKLLRPAGRI